MVYQGQMKTGRKFQICTFQCDLVFIFFICCSALKNVMWPGGLKDSDTLICLFNTWLHYLNKIYEKLETWMFSLVGCFVFTRRSSAGSLRQSWNEWLNYCWLLFCDWSNLYFQSLRINVCLFWFLLLWTPLTCLCLCLCACPHRKLQRDV